MAATATPTATPTIWYFYPDADPESTSTDGRTARASVNETFASIRAGSGNNANATDASLVAPSLSASTTTNQYAILRRAVWIFDTSAIPAGAVVSAANLSLYATAKSNGLGSPDLVIDAPTTASNTNVSSTDYALANWAGTELGRVTYADWTTGGYEVITLDTDAVTVNGITRLGGRLGWDFDNSTTGLTWASSAATSYTAYAADNGSNQPRLGVSYAVGGGGGDSGEYYQEFDEDGPAGPAVPLWWHRIRTWWQEVWR